MAKIQESGEMYLETILILSKKINFVRSIDVSEYMGYSKPSVSRAMTILHSSGYILIDKKGYIALTESGHEIATKIYERHNVLCEFLTLIGVDEEIARRDACKMEHDIGDESFAAIKEHLTRLKNDKK